MSGPRPARSLPRRHLGAAASSVLVPAGVWLASACGPGVATPMPEPPIAFDLSGVNNPELTPVTQPQDPEDVVFPGAAGTVPPGAVVRITNLDRTTDTTAQNATPQGGFEAVARATDGQELRFEWVKGEQRSAPGDALFVRPDPTARYQLVPSPRFECLKLSPGFVLDFPNEASVTLGVENGCDGVVTLENPRARLGLVDFLLPATLPLEIARGQSAELLVTFRRVATGLREDVLLFDVTSGGQTIRYPITLRAP